MPTINEVSTALACLAKMTHDHWPLIVPIAGAIIAIAAWLVTHNQIRCRFGR